MDAEAEKRIQAQIAAMTSMYRAQQINGDLFHKLLICAAYEFSVRGEHLRAAAVVQGIPAEYFRDVQRQQMDEDTEYQAVAYILAQNLVESGLVQLGAKISVTMPAARA